jgi:hypothetical protein
MVFYELSEKDSSVLQAKGSLAVWVGVPPDKILKDEFGVFEV